MQQYLDLVRHVLERGVRKATDPQGIGNIAICGHQMRFRMSDGFPLITTRSLKGSWKALVHELLWFLSGSGHVRDLNRHGVKLWDEWATPERSAQYGLEAGDLGYIYGPMWRRWPKSSHDLIRELRAELDLERCCGSRHVNSMAIDRVLRRWEDGEPGTCIDQIDQLVRDLRANPDSRRHVVSAWSPEFADRVFVAPCHAYWKCFVADGKLSLHLFQRSADVPVGVPFNIASYSLLLLMLARVTGLEPHEFVHTLSDTHIYLNQIEAMQELVRREPRDLPRLVISPDATTTDIFNFRLEDFELHGYDPHPPIKIPVGI